MRILIPLLLLVFSQLVLGNGGLFAPSTTGNGEVAKFAPAPYKREIDLRFGSPLKFAASRVSVWVEQGTSSGTPVMWNVGVAGNYISKHSPTIGPLLKTKRFAYWAGNSGAFESSESVLKGVAQLKVLPGESYMIFQVFTKAESDELESLLKSWLKAKPAQAEQDAAPQIRPR